MSELERNWTSREHTRSRLAVATTAAGEELGETSSCRQQAWVALQMLPSSWSSPHWIKAEQPNSDFEQANGT